MWLRVDDPFRLTGVLMLFNFNEGRFDFLGQGGGGFDLPFGDWVTITETDLSPLDHLDINGGHYVIGLIVLGSGANQVDID